MPRCNTRIEAHHLPFVSTVPKRPVVALVWVFQSLRQTGPVVHEKPERPKESPYLPKTHGIDSDFRATGWNCRNPLISVTTADCFDSPERSVNTSRYGGLKLAAQSIPGIRSQLMSSETTVKAGETVTLGQQQITIKVLPADPGTRPAGRLARVLLTVSLLLNFWLLLGPGLSTASTEVPEYFLEGTRGATARIAVVSVEGMISPPFTERWIRQLQQAAKDDSVRGVLLSIDSPGGFVADSHQLHRQIELLAAKKPVFVSMKRLAASGGYYIAVAAGESSRIFAEPTTWTGSIGVIIARYNATRLAETAGVKVEPLTTGPLKDTLNPFRDLTPQETQVWDAILKDSFDRFIGVIDAGRKTLNDEDIRKLATGQIYTAKQALDNGLVDELGYQEDAVKALASKLQLEQYELFEYRALPGLIDAVLGATARQPSLSEQFAASTVPQAMYFASWNPLPLQLNTH